MCTARVPRSSGGISLSHPMWRRVRAILALTLWLVGACIEAQQEDVHVPSQSAQTTAGHGEQGNVATVSAVDVLKEPKHTDVRPSSFQEITPGKTTLEQIKEKMGEPLAEQTRGGETTLSYQLGPFPKVEMIVLDDVVDSIVVYMSESARPSEVAGELGLDEFVPASIDGDQGEPLGLVYPERGVAFSFVPDKSPPRVMQLVLSPISAEFFILRSGDESDTRYERRLADANYAIRVSPDNARAYLCKAHILTAAGLYERALDACEKAIRIDDQLDEARIARAAVHARMEYQQQALEELESLLNQQKLAPLARAEATAQLGDLKSHGSPPDYEAAMELHLKAVQLAAPLASSKNRQQRRQARQLLVEVHLAIANDITRGNWAHKEEAAPKWLRTARTLAEKMVKEDRGDEALKLLLLRQALSCYVGMKGTVDPGEVVQEALQVAEGLTQSAKDIYRRREIQWLLVEALSDAVRIEQMRGNTDTAGSYAERTAQLLAGLAATEENPHRSNAQIGCLYFLVGSTFAIRASDHTQAVHWYEKAMPYLSQTQPTAESPELGRQGQRYVSMGVSYWETGSHAEAIRITEDGLEMMLTAAEAGRLETKTLAVPYGNLAAMYEAVGRGAEAEELASRAATLEGVPASR